MKSKTRKAAVLILAFTAIFYFSGCSVIYGITAPKEFKEGFELSDYPQDAPPIYAGAIVYELSEDGDEISLMIGSEDSFDDVAEFYADYFYDNDIYLSMEKDRSREYIAEGENGYYAFELTVETPDGQWEERLYSSTASIELHRMNIPNKTALKEYIALIETDLAQLGEALDKQAEWDDSEDESSEFEDEIDALLQDISVKSQEISERDVPDLDGFASLSSTESEMFSLTYNIIEEYKVIYEYALMMIDLGNALTDIDVPDDSTLEEIFYTMDEGMDSALALLNDFDAPSYIEDFNNSMIIIFEGMKAADQYCLQAAQLGDSVRLDAGLYTYDVYLRDMSTYIEAFEADVENRFQKIENDVETLSNVHEDLTGWLSAVGKDIDADAEKITAFPESALLGDEPIEVEANYYYPEEIIPGNYRSLGYISFVELSTNKGEANVKVTVEIPGLTQKFEQKYLVSRAETEVKVHPPLLADAVSGLNSGKDMQLNVTVENLDTGELILQESKDISVYSRYDMKWADEYGTQYVENILAWVTPEAPEISSLIRAAANSAYYLTDGVFDSIIGYQQFSDWETYDITYVQVACIMHALATEMNVVYTFEPFSSSSVYVQRVKTPAKVINDQGGLCAETSVTIASALQAMGMHAVLIALPTHMQVAVETWYGSGEYYLIETTALTDAANEEFDYVIGYLTQDEWSEYLDGDDYTAIDCDLADQFGIKAVD